MTDHLYYTPEDFTTEEYERGNMLAIMVIDGDCKVCKLCGAAEGDLVYYTTCEAFREADLNSKFNGECGRG